MKTLHKTKKQHLCLRESIKELRETFSFALMKFGMILILCIMGFSVSAQTVRTYSGTWANLGTFITNSVNAGDTVELTAGYDNITTTLTLSKSITLRSTSGNNFVLTQTGGVRHIRLGSNTHLILENITLDGNTTGGGIGVSDTRNTNLTLTLNSGAVIQNCYFNGFTAYTSGGGTGGGGAILFVADQGGTININNGAIIQDNVTAIRSQYPGGGGAIHCARGGAVKINGGILRRNHCIISGTPTPGFVGGGAILVGGGTSLTMTGGTISDNTCAIDGGGICASEEGNAKSVVTISGGQITNNRSARGGGISLVGCDLNLSGNALISENEATQGGGISATIISTTRPSTITMSGGTITGNKALGDLANNHGGGGIFINTACKLNMTGGTISNNTALESSGGGICVNTAAGNGTTPASANISGGTIIGNTATRGGGIFVRENNTTLTITCTDGTTTISNNTAEAMPATATATGAGCGGGIYMVDRSKLISRNAKYSNNRAAYYMTAILSSDQALYYTNVDNYTGSFTINPSTGTELPYLYNNYDVNYSASVIATFYPNNGDPAIKIGLTNQQLGETVAPPIVTYAQHAFVDWYNNPDLTGAAFDFNTPITANMEFWAKWNKIEKITLDLKLFLQGATNNGDYTFKGEAKNGTYMTNYIQVPRLPWFTELQLPIDNPYGIPGSYPEINNVKGPAYEVVDWILVEIWGNFNESTYTYDSLETRALLLQVDGSVVDVDGNLPEFDVQQGNVRIVVKHRNHLAVMSSEGLSFTLGTVEYDFSTGINKAYTLPLPTLPAQMIMKNNVAALIAGDLNMDYTINATDVNIFNNTFYFVSGVWKYVVADVNMDGAVDAVDSSLILDNFYLRSSYSVLRFFTKNK